MTGHPQHCGLPMMEIYARTSRTDRYDLALTVETINALHQCEHCGARLTTRLDQPLLPAAAPTACCDFHNQHCEPPGELCCQQCAEIDHPDHPDGVCTWAARDPKDPQ
jgi:hypothetical protein